MTMTPEEMDRAGREIAELLKVLVAQMRSLGHEKAQARLRIEGDECAIFLDTRGERAFGRNGWGQSDMTLCAGPTVTVALEGASAAVRGMAESVAKQCAAWFATEQDPPQAPSAAEGSDGLVLGEAVAADSVGEGGR